ncbi:MAG: SDR family NAD(P)-dependent oxidoreductase [Rhodobacteraceae bacterium]|nr:SDR family NAD(P)-dependent oxidoreductase [Paracoccaceae bacterium]
MAGLAIVIGAGPGLGAALARRFARGGFDVAAVARDARRLDGLAREIRAAGGRAEGFSADVTDFASIRRAVMAAAETFGPPRVLIYNVSQWVPAEAPDLDPEILDLQLRICATSALAATQAVLPAMRGDGGTVLWTGGGLALRPQNGRASPALTAGKSAMRGLALATAPALHDIGINFATITVNGAIAPDTRFAPDRIAERFWQAHEAPRSDWTGEIIFDGA